MNRLKDFQNQNSKSIEDDENQVINTKLPHKNSQTFHLDLSPLANAKINNLLYDSKLGTDDLTPKTPLLKKPTPLDQAKTKLYRTIGKITKSRQKNHNTIDFSPYDSSNDIVKGRKLSSISKTISTAHRSRASTKTTLLNVTDSNLTILQDDSESVTVCSKFQVGRSLMLSSLFKHDMNKIAYIPQKSKNISFTDVVISSIQMEKSRKMNEMEQKKGKIINFLKQNRIRFIKYLRISDLNGCTKGIQYIIEYTNIREK